MLILMIVDILQRNGIMILGVLEYNPRWHEGPWNLAPDPDLYEKFACSIVSHFKDRVKYWEIWNEPDTKTYWIPQDEMKAYTALLKKVYPAIKKIDPTCKVLMGGVSCMPNISLVSLSRSHLNKVFCPLISSLRQPINPSL